MQESNLVGFVKGISRIVLHLQDNAINLFLKQQDKNEWIAKY